MSASFLAGFTHKGLIKDGDCSHLHVKYFTQGITKLPGLLEQLTLQSILKVLESTVAGLCLRSKTVQPLEFLNSKTLILQLFY